jgi:hypothetical protein
MQCQTHLIEILRSNSIIQTLNLFFNDYEFESFQGYWKFTWLLILEPVILDEIQ